MIHCDIQLVEIQISPSRMAHPQASIQPDMNVGREDFQEE